MLVSLNPFLTSFLGSAQRRTKHGSANTAQAIENSKTPAAAVVLDNQGVRARLTFYDLFDGFVYGSDAQTLYRALSDYNSKKSTAFRQAVNNANAVFRVEMPQDNGRKKSEYLSAIDVVRGVMEGRIPMKELERVVDVCLRSSDPTALRNLNVTKAKIATRYTPASDPNRDLLSRIAQLPIL
jgi:hypothetical protein